MKQTRKIALTITSIVLSVALFSVAIFAWVVAQRKSNELFIFTSDIDLKCEVYVANDDNDDGIADYLEDPTIVITESRTKILSTYYRTMTQAKEYNNSLIIPGEEPNNYFKNIYLGRQIRYKVVITNASKSKNDAKIDISFSDLTEYFKNCVIAYLQTPTQETLASFRDEFGKNSSRLLFNIKERKSTLYVGENYNLKSSGQQEDLFSEEVTPLWKNSMGEKNGEKFIEGALLKYGNLVEIDFALSCDFATEDINKYNAGALEYYKPLFKGESYSEAALNDAITKVAYEESLYVLDDTQGTTTALNFTIGKIIIRGTQQPRNSIL